MTKNFRITFMRGISIPVALLVSCVLTTQASAFQSESKVVESDKPAPSEKVPAKAAESTSDQTETDETKSVKDQLEKLTAEYQIEMVSWREEFKAAKTRAEKAELVQNSPAIVYSAKLRELYEANPDDKDAQNAFRIALESIGPKATAEDCDTLLEIAREQDPEDAKYSYIVVLKYGAPTAKREAVDKLLEVAKNETDDDTALEMLSLIVNPRVNWKTAEAAEEVWNRLKANPEEADFEALATVALKARPETSRQAYAALLEHHGDNEDLPKVLAVVPKTPNGGFETVVNEVFKNGEGDLQTQAAISLARYAEIRHFYLDFKRMPEKQLAYLKKEKENLKEFLGDVDAESELYEQAQAELFLIENLSPGLKAKDIVGNDLDGEELKLSDYRGKLVLLSFWGNWCPPCRAMFPHERSLARTLADEPFTIIGVNSDKTPNVSETVCEPQNLTWPNFTDFQGDERISDEWRVRTWPTTYLIDKDGVIRFKGLRGRDLDIAIEELLAEMDIEVKLSDINHYAEDAKAMEAYQKARKADGFSDPIVNPKTTKGAGGHSHDHDHSHDD